MKQLVTAKLSYLRMGPRKVRLVADLIRGRSVGRAIDILTVTNKRPAKPLLKLLLSAVANAKHNFSLAQDKLKVVTLTVDGGPMLKRWMPKAHGRATPVRERTSHINLVLSGEKLGEPKSEKTETHVHEEGHEHQHGEKHEVKSESKSESKKTKPSLKKTSTKK
jgi:large subunit ribosomal protein L22